MSVSWSFNKSANSRFSWWILVLLSGNKFGVKLSEWGENRGENAATATKVRLHLSNVKLLSKMYFEKWNWSEQWENKHISTITVPCRSKYLHSPEKIKNQTICVSASNGCILHDIGKLWILPRKLRNWENDEIQGGIFSSYIFITHLKHQFLENLIKPTLSIKKYLLQ